ncbi:hypothetical protein [Xylophilus sp.]|uniref:hypothetical protein n=1 Tax=Xylophilus sp. TaxID=2653893 RepID=UPI0013BE8822|nr:hypothetical protein [Xylophilus sp.]KAF1048564.1 MAG: hypothetical protein GAK38_01315 [Xylophilus sp.]
MPISDFRFFLCTVPLLWGTAVSAAPDPLDAQAPLPPVAPTPSAFDGYVSGRDDPPRVPWPQANAAVAEAGGWRALAREAQQGTQNNPPPVHDHNQHKERAP